MVEVSQESLDSGIPLSAQWSWSWVTEEAFSFLKYIFQGRIPSNLTLTAFLIFWVWCGVGILQSVNKIITKTSLLWRWVSRVTEKTKLCPQGSGEVDKAATTWDSHYTLKLIESSSVCLSQKNVEETNNCGGRKEDEVAKEVLQVMVWPSSLSCSRGPCRYLAAGLCCSESCHGRVVLRIPQGQPCSVAPQGVFQRSHRMNMSLKIYGNPNRRSWEAQRCQ